MRTCSTFASLAAELTPRHALAPHVHAHVHPRIHMVSLEHTH